MQLKKKQPLFYWLPIAIIAVGASLAPLSRAEGPGGPDGFQPPRLNQAQRQVFESCLKDKGIKPPQGGPGSFKPDPKNKAAFDDCKNQSNGDRDAFRSCLKDKGITPPQGGPKGDHAAFEACMEKAQNSGND